MKRFPLVTVLTLVVSFIVFGQSSYPNLIKTIEVRKNEKFNLWSEPAGALQSGLGPSLVSIKSRQMIVRKRNPDGTLAAAFPYLIRGVDWSPAGTGTTSALSSRRLAFEQWAGVDIPLIKNMNANTVFTYLDANLNANGIAVLDQLYNNGLMVVMTVDEGTNNRVQTQQAVNFFKNHPAILAWNVGVEWNINLYFGNASSVLDAANRTQTAANLIKSLDANHPVLTSYGDIHIETIGKQLSDTKNYVNNICTSVDGWALNIFRNSDFGTLFDQWKSISNKPMLLGEFGTDAFRTYNPEIPAGRVDDLMQAQWNLSEWNHLAKNLSANHPGKSAIGGFLFEWNDEWWKVPNSDGQQDANGGDSSVCSGHPDTFCNEEYFGIVALDPNNTTRLPRAVYNVMTQAFAANYQPPASQTVIYRATSAGCTVPSTACGFARFFKNNAQFYTASGGGGGGRGFNVAVIDPCTGSLLQPAQNFDTWITRNTGTAMTSLTNFLNSLPNGVLVMLAVADEAGLTQDQSCTHFPPAQFPWIEPFYQALEGLGSTQIRQYCFWNSWAMVAVKGEGAARAEQLGNAVDVSTQTMLSLQSMISPASRAFAASPGRGTVRVSVPGGCNWTAVSNDNFLTINSGSSGTGNGIVTYSVNANSSVVRTGTMTIAGHLFTVTQTPQGEAAGRTSFAFDTDAQTDLSVWRPSEGRWYIFNSTNGTTTMEVWGVSSDVIVPEDYDGDGKTDIAIWRPSSGLWYIVRSSNGTIDVQGWGVNGDIPVPGDYDGDGKADIAVWRPSAGVWYIVNSSSGSILSVGWGINGDNPVPGDYDGDGKTDIAVWRPSNGTWYIINSANNSLSTFGWGTNTDKAVQGDYDGDSKTDIAVWRPTTGTWYVINSSNSSITIFGWGVNTDKAVPGDYDGDGRTDIAVWRPGTGIWYIVNSSNGSIRIQGFGQNGDLPAPSAFIR